MLGLPIADLTRAEVVDRLVAWAVSPKGPVTAFAVHIGGLSIARDEGFREAMEAADIAYADGVSAVLLARIAGAERIERSPTTDIGWELLRRFLEQTGRPARVVAIGGVDGLSAAALRVFEEQGLAQGGIAFHGYHRDWDSVLCEVEDHSPDVILVGLGAPLEMVWVQRNLAKLPAALVLTCGGWFGFVVGDEPRAPETLRRLGLEWLFRWRNQPRRLAGRYLRGLGYLPLLMAKVLIDRIRGRLDG